MLLAIAKAASTAGQCLWKVCQHRMQGPKRAAQTLSGLSGSYLFIQHKDVAVGATRGSGACIGRDNITLGHITACSTQHAVHHARTPVSGGLLPQLPWLLLLKPPTVNIDALSTSN